ncbi:glutamate-rich protein 2 isoform X2 [Xyrauchen texanus]|uniref:glutamate-rich protein 2 isoform X2 n=1 Tax=Xyrauchen texanus TaxID=154827 RepID=UPI0022425546|nr:glutamate-rich protein 2 isoform X2 [Xyrauchen texanus]
MKNYHFYFSTRRKDEQCVGRPSEVSPKVNEQEAAPIKPVCASLADPVKKQSVDWKPNGKTEVHTSINSESESTNPTLKAQSSNRQQKLKPSGMTEVLNPSINPTPKEQNAESRGYSASPAPSFKNVTTHGHKLPKQSPPVMTEKQATSEVQLGSEQELQIQTPQAVLSENDRDPHEAQGEDEESEEAENETSEGHVPLELFAEFLQAVMTKNYKLAKKLCQMILIYEPQNSEAKKFLPLIEEKLLIEAEEESDNDNDESDEFDTSDDDDDDDDDEEDDGSDDDDDNNSSDSCDTDEESTDSTDDTLSSSS